jgi:prepilin peptidase CpaA
MNEPLSPLFGFLALGVFAVLMGVAAIGDVRTLRITNKLNAGIALAFVALAIPMGLGWPEFFAHIKIGVIASVIALILFLTGLYGGGDFKMTGATALWLGPSAAAPFVIYAILSGGLLCLVLLTGRYVAGRFGLPASPKWARRLLRKNAGVPYGVAIGIGGLMAAPFAVWFPSITSG